MQDQGVFKIRTYLQQKKKERKIKNVITIVPNTEKGTETRETKSL